MRRLDGDIGMNLSNKADYSGSSLDRLGGLASEHRGLVQFREHAIDNKSKHNYPPLPPSYAEICENDFENVVVLQFIA